MSETVEVDVVVLGAGPGGETVGGLLGKAGVDVVVVEEHLVGGECPFYGCVPSKLMIAGARRAAEGSPDWAHVAQRIRSDATHDWTDTPFAERLVGHGARLVRGRGRIVGPRRVAVDGTTYVARRGVVLNTGTRPAVPPVEGLAGTPFWTNRDIVRLTELPGSIVVLGAGPIGVELAQVLARFGVAVTLVDQAPRLLPRDEPEASRVLAEALAADGVRLVLSAGVDRVAHADGGFVVEVGEETLRAERLLVAAGRTLQLDDLGLEAADVVVDGGALEVDERMRVRAATAGDGGGPWLWAVGDITGKGAFTHVSNYQGRVAVRDLLGQDGPWADYRAATRVTYTEPEIAVVGLTEAQARESGAYAMEVAVGDLGARGWLDETDGVVKLVADTSQGSGVLVGATVAGPAAGEVIGLLATAVHARVPLADLRTMHFAYPTYHRAIETVLWRLPH
ncbi:NAD(P)/FAD-dependent oxidoreductase [Nocardioides zeae]|uniref:NAD(P)/FAD-dependent oxidoreductase n=1 Tax=Nocardioides imazamoxiresistens TaxID=3231893 RepID=A0ABU3PZE8_9ACTN|nr:NAD(P)/FAD-dependent oxidoreductase [Nocardioides zeae]MDT9594626.1 NAD(P)/FAD-dependent oxidoreductase [Nocardioides zeae]